MNVKIPPISAVKKKHSLESLKYKKIWVFFYSLCTFFQTCVACSTDLCDSWLTDSRLEVQSVLTQVSSLTNRKYAEPRNVVIISP